MTEAILITLISAALKDDAIRKELEALFFGVVTLVLHRHATDPDFHTKSDAARAAFNAATTPEARLNAQKAIQSLLSS